ncbi:MAG TPA: hypothetical protein VGD17_00840 [Chitinophagaceae bacterium]
MKLKLFLGLIVLMSIGACKKGKNDVSLKGLWIVENSVYKEYENNTLTLTETEPGNGTTVDFQDNGNVVIKEASGSIESYPYQIISATVVKIDGDDMEVRNLNSSTVSLFRRDDWAPGEYSEILLNLKR